MDYFYDGQLRKYFIQFIRIFNSFMIQIGKDANGDPIMKKVPARYGDLTRNVANAMRENSENILNTVPIIACYVSNLELSNEWRTDPTYERTVPVTEKYYDEKTNTYVDKPGQKSNVTRRNPVPYRLTMTVDIWTSNTDQKMQILEQIMTVFNPTLNFRTSQNPMDWSNLTYCEMTDLNWSSRSMPVGVDDPIDMATLTFVMPIAMNPPVAVQQQSLIQTIIHNMYMSGETLDSWSVDDLIPDLTVVVTPGNYQVETFTEEGVHYLKILDEHGVDNDLKWEDIFAIYGTLDPGSSVINLRSSVSHAYVSYTIMDVDTEDEGLLILETTPGDNVYEPGNWQLEGLHE